MDYLALYEITALLIILIRLITLRRNHPVKLSVLSVTYWLAIVVCCMLIVRLLDGRILASRAQLAFIVLFGVIAWVDKILKN
ncbi:MAG TPA: hypothetical protein VGN40_19245 [Lelliottia sp.]|jgi:hypothetical protein